MFALVSPEKIQLPAGSVVRLPATWQDYQSLYDRRGDGSIPRLKYRRKNYAIAYPVYSRTSGGWKARTMWSLGTPAALTEILRNRVFDQICGLQRNIIVKTRFLDPQLIRLNLCIQNLGNPIARFLQMSPRISIRTPIQIANSLAQTLP